MAYIRSRKFCCCLPVRFGVFCESLLGIAVSGFFAILGFIEIARMMQGKLSITHTEKIALWVLAGTMTVFALSSFLGLVGAIGRYRGLVGLYATVITAVTVLNIAGGIFFIYGLFHGEGDDTIAKCEADAKDFNQNVGDFACNTSFKTARIVIVVVYVLFWLIEIYGCVIAFEYVGQLNEEEDARSRGSGSGSFEKSQSNQSVTIVNQPAYPYTAPQNAYGRV